MKVIDLNNSYEIRFTRKELKELKELKEFRGMKSIEQTIKSALRIEMELIESQVHLII